jgi:ELWxxDGT repeat protein
MRTIRLLLLSVLSLALLGATVPSPSFTPYRVKDIDPQPRPDSSNPSDFVSLGRLALFNAEGDHGGLWRSDGTVSGTYRLLDFGARILAATGDRCFFASPADDRWHLGITDGTLPGTVILAEVEPLLSSRGAWIPRQRLFYFLSSSHQLWRSDGTPGGTYAVADIPLKPDFYDFDFETLTSFHGRLYLTTGFALWQSDGTAAGTVQVRAVQATALQVVGPFLVFVGTDSQGSELWASDGTAAGTRRIADLTPGAGSTTFKAFKVVGNRLFFVATTSTRGDELYVTDGTVQGTRRLTWLSDPYALTPEYPKEVSLGALGGRLLFAASDQVHGRELWSSDGTPQGTRLLLDLAPGAPSSEPGDFLQHQGRIYFRAGGGLWVTDGTAGGTQMLNGHIWPYGAWSWVAEPASDRVFLIIYGDDGWDTSAWATDGTAKGTVLVDSYGDEALSMHGTSAGGVLFYSGEDDDHGIELFTSEAGFLYDINDRDLGGSLPHGLMTLGDSVLFFARDGQGSVYQQQGYALCRSDGTEAGTRVVKRNLGGRIAWTASASRVFFVPTQAHEVLWTSDGTEAGTVRLTPPGVRVYGPLSAPVIKLGNRVFFSAWFPPSGTEPWVTDGTPQGTRMLADLNPGREGSSPAYFTVFAGRIWFAAGLHLWKSDGTAKGTAAVGPELQNPRPWMTYGGRLWFTGKNGAGHTELWATDGTAARTERIAEPGTVESLTVHGGRLWFLSDGRELWSTDGTTAGTRKISLPASSFRLLLSDGTRLYLSDSQPALWVSDGTAAGTRAISDAGIQDGPWIAIAGRLYYVSSAGTLYTSDGTLAGTRPVRPDGKPTNVGTLLRFGDRLIAVTVFGGIWESDGTAESTRWIRDVSWTGSYPREIAKAGPRLFFPSWDETTGTELWAMHE